MKHDVHIVRRSDLASHPWQIEINRIAINLHDNSPTDRQIAQAIERYDERMAALSNGAPSANENWHKPLIEAIKDGLLD